MNTLRPPSASLLSVKGLKETKDECIRILEQLQIVVDPTSIQTDTLSCELMEISCQHLRPHIVRVQY